MPRNGRVKIPGYQMSREMACAHLNKYVGGTLLGVRVGHRTQNWGFSSLSMQGRTGLMVVAEEVGCRGLGCYSGWARIGSKSIWGWTGSSSLVMLWQKAWG